VEILNSASGASSIRKDVPFRQIFRDMQAVALHAALNPNAGLEVYGVCCSASTPPRRSSEFERRLPERELSVVPTNKV